MRVRSLWANLQSIPDTLFHFQGDIAERPVRQIQSTWRSMEAGIGLTRSKRDSRPTQRISSKRLQRPKEEERQKSCFTERSKAKIAYSSRNIKTTHGAITE